LRLFPKAIFSVFGFIENLPQMCFNTKTIEESLEKNLFKERGKGNASFQG
jgi:hypothetical protein